jgi:hypothetical protein
MKDTYTQAELDSIVGSVSDRVGWDFSSMKVERQPIPWEYINVVKEYLKSTDTVLDVGTGGGERFIQISKSYARGVGVDIDPEMVTVATRNAEHKGNVTFTVGDASLSTIYEQFDVVINRHCKLDMSAAAEHLKEDGYFITQQVGERNMQNIKLALNQTIDSPVVTRDDVLLAGLKLLAFCEYDVEYVVKDIESLVFWLKALNMLNSDLNGAQALDDANLLNQILNGNVDDRGFVTNEQRFLVIAQK